MAAEPLVLAVPSKGRLQSQAASYFAEAGLDLIQPGGGRTYRGAVKNAPNVEVAFLSASDIPAELAAGGAHLGVTGRDLVEDNVEDWEHRLDLVAPLGFGKADVVVAVPEAWIDVETMADLDDVAADFRRRHGRRLKVATKYYNLTRRFFAGHGIADYRIVESLGATEGTPASGAADLIVDITSTGSTLAANALKRVSDGTILKSEAYLVAALTASWTAAAVDALASIVEPIAGKRALERLLRKTRERR
jgi:ATP phosphoribosyltransferase